MAKRITPFTIPQRRYNISPYDKPNYWPVVIGLIALIGIALLIGEIGEIG